ncbi:hypothetical protein ILUMI_01076 [Ignelater luminosus]|uniref:BBSome-interacting protein 1 n=1 Tax=Ignelater luminosus TaxID=2038154 RepID=A0A8K0DKR6_IGNLU|nr:hypothetical protein ILUMI_01076 [Ignelater luminosus]
MSKVTDDIKPVLPKNGQLIIEDSQEFVMCKPRLIPLKSFTLEKLEKMQQQVQLLQEQATNKPEQED